MRVALWSWMASGAARAEPDPCSPEVVPVGGASDEAGQVRIDLWSYENGEQRPVAVDGSGMTHGTEENPVMLTAIVHGCFTTAAFDSPDIGCMLAWEIAPSEAMIGRYGHDRFREFIRGICGAQAGIHEQEFAVYTDGWPVAEVTFRTEVQDIRPELRVVRDNLPDYGLHYGGNYGVKLQTDGWFYDQVRFEVRGEVPPGMVWGSEKGEWSAGISPDRHDRGEWAFDVVAIDEEGSESAVSLEFDVVGSYGGGPFGCTTGGLPAVPWILAAAAGVTRRRRV